MFCQLIIENLQQFMELKDIVAIAGQPGLYEKVKEGLVVPEKKSNDDLFPQFLGKVLPSYDNERIYLSDMKKLANWYIILSDKLDFDALRKSLDEENNATDEQKSEAKAKTEAKAKIEKPVKNAGPKGDSKSKGKSVGTIRKMA